MTWRQMVVVAVVVLAVTLIGAREARSQIFVLPDKPTLHVVEGGGTDFGLFNVFNLGPDPVTIDSDLAFTGSTRGDITDSIIVDAVQQGAIGTIQGTKPDGKVKPPKLAVVSFHPFSFPDAGPPDDGNVDLFYQVHTTDGKTFSGKITVFVSDTPESPSLLLFGAGTLVPLACALRRHKRAM